MNSIIITPSEMNDYYAYNQFSIKIPYSISALYSRAERKMEQFGYTDIAIYSVQISFDYDSIEGLGQFISSIYPSTEKTVTVSIYAGGPYVSSEEVLKYGYVRGENYGQEYDSYLQTKVKNGFNFGMEQYYAYQPEFRGIKITDDNTGDVIFSGTNDSIEEFFSAFRYPWADPIVASNSSVLKPIYTSINKVQLEMSVSRGNDNSPILDAYGQIYKTSVDNQVETLVSHIDIQVDDYGVFYTYVLDLDKYRFSKDDTVTANFTFNSYGSSTTETFTFKINNVIKVYCEVDNEYKVGALYCRPSVKEEFKLGTDLYQKDENEYIKRVDTR